MPRVDATTKRNDDPSSVAPESRTQESSSSSVVADEEPESYDPLARALNTLQFGLLVHFGTTTALSWSSSSSSSSSSSCAPNDRLGWASILLLHEYWVYLQHFNVLANPLCQRLDRQYGIALLRRNRHWAIAGTLSAYWCRESVCLFLCLPFCASSVVRYLVVYSLAYHTIKSRGVRSDALRRSSPTLGIMRVVIDRFYTNDATERAVSVFRLFLQGSDTAIHYAVVRELWYRTCPETHRAVHALFVAWVAHAALNQYFRRSTASLMVEAWNNATATPPSSTEKSDRRSERRPSLVRSSVSMIGEEERESLLREDDDDAAPSSDDDDDDENDVVDEHYVVRSLLRPGRVSDDLKGRCGTASNGVDAAVRVETVVTVLATLYVVGLGDAPLRLTATATTTMSELVGSAATEIATKDPWFALCYAWTLTALLHSAGTVAFAKRRRESKSDEDEGRSNRHHHHRRRDNTSLLLATVDVAVTTWGGVFSAHSRNDDGGDLLSAALALLIVVRSFLFASRAAVGRRRRRPDGRRPLGPRIARYFARVAEFYVRLRLARTLLVEDRRPTIDAVGVLVSVAWACVVSSRDAEEPLPGPPSRPPPPPPPPPDVVFLGHPGALSDAWALWSIPYPMDDRWRAGPRWLFDGLLWPLHYSLSCYMCVARRRLLGDAHAHFECDENAYAATDHQDDVVRVATWTSNHFGRHFVTRPEEVRRNVAGSARHADALGARVLCLGALNKAERVNGGGVGVVRDLGPERRVAVVHGNHLTAAAVVETTTRLLGGSSCSCPSSVAEKRRIFVTGASSKVGWAVARWLRARGGHDVLCHSTDAGRRRSFEKEGFEAASSLHEGAAFSKLWIVGKGDPGVADAIPHGAVAVCFSVPSPPRLRETRPDVRVVEAGTLHADPCRFDPPRSFANKLREHEMFACHAAGVVAAYEMRRGGKSRDEIDEVGPVDPDVLEERLRAAEAIGFRTPSVTPIVSSCRGSAAVAPDVLVVGAGPSGLATAAALRRRGVSCAILERRTEPDAFGSWDAHFSPLTVTTRRRWCSLPGFSMETWDPRRAAGTDDKVDAPTYLRYLRAYATRFDLDVRRGFDCRDVRRNLRTGDWILEAADGTSATAPHVVVATGRNGAPRRDTDDGVGDKLRSAGVDVMHSTDLRTEEDWTKVAAAARDGALLVVGLGNSAADVLTEVLGRCEKQRTDTTTTTTTTTTVVAPLVHVSVRTVPPVFPFAHGPLRVDAVGAVLRRAPRSVRRGATALLRRYLSSTVACDRAFPPRLPRWDRVDGDRVPVVDKEGRVAEALASGAVVGRGPVAGTTEDGRVFFDDGVIAAPVRVSTAVLATGYRRTAPLERDDPLNGVHAVGLFGNVGYLPLTAIGEEAEAVAARIAEATTERENHAATTSRDDRR